LPGGIHTALRVLLLSVALLAAVSAGVAVCMALAPYLPTLLVGVAVSGLYAVATCPRKAVRA
jgi:ABC-type uncharacterized transport system YnjBCD permease subunit